MVVAENQRWRLVGAGAAVFFEHGSSGTTSKRIAISAGVSSSAFYDHFDDVSDCLRAAFDVAADSLLRTLTGRCKDASGRHDRTRTGVEDLLAFCRAEPQLSRLLGAELSAAQREIGLRRSQLIGRLGVLLDERGRGEDRAPLAAVNQHLAAAALALNCNGEQRQSPVPPDFATQLSVLLELAQGASRLRP